MPARPRSGSGTSSVFGSDPDISSGLGTRHADPKVSNIGSGSGIILFSLFSVPILQDNGKIMAYFLSNPEIVPLYNI